MKFGQRLHKKYDNVRDRDKKKSTISMYVRTLQKVLNHFAVHSYGKTV